MKNQQIALLQSIEAVLKSPLQGLHRRLELEAIFQHVGKLDREILLNLEFTPLAVIPPMWLAVQRGMPEVMAWLVDYGASVDGKSPHDQALLLSAIDQGHIAGAKALLALGANPKVLTTNGSNGVMLALARGHRDLVEALMSAGVSLTEVNQKGMNALHFAAMSGDVGLFEWVRGQVEFTSSTPDLDGRTPLTYCRSFELFEGLRREDPHAELRKPFADGDQPIHYFCLHGQLETVRYLLDQGIDVQALGQWKNTALHYGVSSGNTALVQLLIARGAKVEARNKAGLRPMHWAAELGNVAMIDVLLAHKAQVKIKGNTQWIILQTHSPLYLAAKNGHLEAARRLLEAGAEVNALNDAACRTALCAASARDDLAMADLLLAHGASPIGINSDKDRFNAFPLADASSAEMVNRLITAGADVNAAGRYQDTALHHLTKSTTELHLSSAVAAMPSVEAYNPYCIRSRYRKQLAACASLLDAGASPFARDYGGKQAHEHATVPAVSAMLLAARTRITQSFDERRQLPELLAPLMPKIQKALATPQQPNQATRVHIVSDQLTYVDLLLLQQSIEARFGPVLELVQVDATGLPVTSVSTWLVV